MADCWTKGFSHDKDLKSEEMKKRPFFELNLLSQIEMKEKSRHISFTFNVSPEPKQW